MKRMERYVLSVVIAAAVVGLLFMAHTGSGRTHSTLGTIDWSIIGAASALAALSVWGMIGVALSQLKQRIREGAAVQEVKISKKSWHYRMNAWVNFNTEPSRAISECEYWARFFHGFYAFSPLLVLIFVLLYPIVTIGIAVLGWFFSARTNWKVLPRAIFPNSNVDDPFGAGHQVIGPIVFSLLLLGGLAAGLTLSGAYEGMYGGLAHAPWTSIGKGSLIGLSSLLGAAMALYVLVSIIWPKVLAPFFSYAGARIAGVCRPVSFTD